MKEKQIKELEEDITECFGIDPRYYGVEGERLAEFLHKKGYHKQNEGEWISVGDRLPEDQQRVLTIDTEGEMQVCFYKTAWKGVFHMYHGLVKIFNITHWMPLPEPPKMKGGE